MPYTPQTTGVINPTPTQYNVNPTYYDPAYGGIPNLPPYTTDTTQQAGTDVQAQMIANLPGYQSAVQQAMTNVGYNLQGQVAPDVARNLGIRAAEFGAGGGLSLSPAAVTSFLSRYGLTSQALQDNAQKQLLAQMQATPIQQTSTAQQTADLAAQRAVYASAPSPAAAAKANLKSMGAGLATGLGAARTPTMPALTPYPTMGTGTSGIADDTWYYGTGSGNAGFLPSAGASAVSPTGQITGVGGQLQETDLGFMDTQGNEWIDLGGMYFNLDTGEAQAEPQNEPMAGPVEETPAPDYSYASPWDDLGYWGEE